MQYVTHHNTRFVLETSDWENRTDSEKAAKIMEDGVLQLSQSQVEQIKNTWNDLDEELEDRNKYYKDMTPAGKLIFDIEKEVFDQILKNYASENYNGHNYTISMDYPEDD